MLPGGNVSHSTHASSHEMNSNIFQDDDEINSINNVRMFHWKASLGKGSTGEGKTWPINTGNPRFIKNSSPSPDHFKPSSDLIDFWSDYRHMLTLFVLKR